MHNCFLVINSPNKSVPSVLICWAAGLDGLAQQNAHQNWLDAILKAQRPTWQFKPVNFGYSSHAGNRLLQDVAVQAHGHAVITAPLLLITLSLGLLACSSVETLTYETAAVSCTSPMASSFQCSSEISNNLSTGSLRQVTR